MMAATGVGLIAMAIACRIRISQRESGGEDRCKMCSNPKVQMQAHSAPLGLAFYAGTQFPAEYRNNIFVAFHGIAEPQHSNRGTKWSA